MENKKNGDFIITESVQKYKNPWIEVVEEKVIRPDGKPGLFGIVKALDGASVLPMDEEGFVYLVDEFHYALGKNDMETISGGREANENYLDAAKRELKEETGIEAKEWVDLGITEPLTTFLNCPQKLFLARKLSFSKSNPEESEDIKLVKIKFEEAVQMVMESKILHAPSCVLILKAEKYLK
jgi:8-oxo-dGTP pyrophosphatase MutT (NUDIX family)